jgi:hypothetical protein
VQRKPEHSDRVQGVPGRGERSFKTPGPVWIAQPGPTGNLLSTRQRPNPRELAGNNAAADPGVAGVRMRTPKSGGLGPASSGLVWPRLA